MRLLLSQIVEFALSHEYPISVSALAVCIRESRLFQGNTNETMFVWLIRPQHRLELFKQFHQAIQTFLRLMVTDDQTRMVSIAYHDRSIKIWNTSGDVSWIATKITNVSPLCCLAASTD